MDHQMLVQSYFANFVAIEKRYYLQSIIHTSNDTVAPPRVEIIKQLRTIGNARDEEIITNIWQSVCRVNERERVQLTPAWKQLHTNYTSTSSEQ